MDTSSPYLGIVAMLVESYALECAWSTAAAISVGLKDPSFSLFVANDSTVKVCGFSVIVRHLLL